MAQLKVADYSLILGNEKGSFTLRLEGNPWTSWTTVSAQELGAMAAILETGNAVYDTNRRVLILPAKAQRGEDAPPPLE